MLILQQMLVLFLIMVAGFFAEQKKILDEDACKKISWIVVNIANPSMILSSVSGDSRIQPEELAVTILIAVCMFGCLIALAAVLPMALRADKSQYGVYRVMTVFSNIGFMGFPILSALYGKESLLYAALFVLIYNVLIYTYGILCLNRNSQGSFGQAKISDSLKQIGNVGVLSAVGALILYFGNISLPAVLSQAFEMFADLTAPLSMMVIGASFGQMSIKDMAMDVRLLVFSAVKLLAVPVGGMWVLSRFVENPILLGVCLVMLATPVGSLTAMLAKQYDCDSELASRGVALTTLLSVAAIPAVAAICRGMGIAV
ncbi:AEC family transporter [Petralouisia muris]|uniref:AEC family transporter n=1 Tax=Petralouisia muris TaxID=3032872 RepID=A0AC61RVB6_9FIRM|nr:AEC family transporter [Petralouisia muris]TGY95712.1 AEC family transporter [Petralouisia muris]